MQSQRWPAALLCLSLTVCKVTWTCVLYFFKPSLDNYITKGETLNLLYVVEFWKLLWYKCTPSRLNYVYSRRLYLCVSYDVVWDFFGTVMTVDHEHQCLVCPRLLQSSSSPCCGSCSDVCHCPPFLFKEGLLKMERWGLCPYIFLRLPLQ